MSQNAVLPLLAKIGICVAASCFGTPAFLGVVGGDIAKNVLGDWAGDVLKKVPELLRPQGQPNHDLQHALARATARACEDLDLDTLIRSKTNSLTDLEPPHHFHIETFVTALHRRPEEALQHHITAGNVDLKAFLEAPSPATFKPLATIFGADTLPGLSDEVRATLIEELYLRIAARFWDEVKGSHRAWRAYSGEVFREFRSAFSQLADGQQEILRRLGEREAIICPPLTAAEEQALREHDRRAEIPREVLTAIDATRSLLESELKRVHAKLDQLLAGVGEIKGQLGEVKDGIGELSTRLDMLTRALEVRAAISRDCQQAGLRIEDMPQDQIEQDLARRLGIPVETLRASIAAGLKSEDALTRSRAELLAGNRDAAIASAEEAKRHHADAIRQLIAADDIIALAQYEKGDYPAALAARRRTIAYTDPETEPLVWADRVQKSIHTLTQLGRYDEAITLNRQVIAIRERELGPADLSLATARCSLGDLLIAWHQPEEAELLIRQAMETFQAVDHPEAALVINSLGLLVANQGNLPEAERLLRQALEIAETNPGEDPHAVSTGLTNLALILEVQGKLVEAEPLLRRALAISEAKLGSQHPHLVGVFCVLARLLNEQGNSKEAEYFYRKAIEIGEAKLGKDHPHIAVTLNFLVTMLLDEGTRLEEAEQLARRALQIGEAKFSKDHPHFIGEIYILACTLQRQGRLEEAEALFRRSLQIAESTLGHEHLGAANMASSLAVVLADMGKLEEVETLRRRALRIREATLDKDHPDIAMDLSDLADLLSDQGKPAESGPLYRRAVGILFLHRHRNGTPNNWEPRVVRSYTGYLQKQDHTPEQIEAELQQLAREAGLDA